MAYGVKSQDSVQVNIPVIVHSTNGETQLDGSLLFSRPDSSLDNLQIVNPAIANFYNDLGNFGSAADPALFSNAPNVLTEFGNHAFDLYQWRPSDVVYYKTNKRYSDLHYHMSGGKEQQITLTMAQNIVKNWNAGIDFNRQASKGFLSNGKTFITNFNFFTWYHLPNQRYHLFASATWNSIRNKVNGGLADDSLYSQNDFSNNDLEGLKISLSNAEQRKRNHIFQLTHFYDLVTRNDSTGKPQPEVRIRHQSEYGRSSYAYNDNGSDSSYYENTYFGDEIPDSLHYDEWTHRISALWYHTFDNCRPLYRTAVEFTSGSQWFRYRQLYDTTLFNYFVEGRLRTASLKNRYTLEVTGSYVPAGENEKNYFFHLRFRFPLLFGSYMSIGLQQARQSPALMANFYQSNHFLWENDFDKITSAQFFFRIDADEHRFSVGGTSTTIGRYVYYNSEARPEQSNDSIRVSQLYIRKDFHLWKFRLNNSVWIQNTDHDLIRIPGLASHHSLYYEDLFFRKKLATQIGFDVHYTDAYYSNDYSPATAVFFLQDTEKTNGYALVDFFINFRIKSARLFFKLQNVGDNLVANKYLTTRYYPMPGLVFQFGVNWRFFD